MAERMIGLIIAVALILKALWPQPMGEPSIPQYHIDMERTNGDQTSPQRRTQ